jgi:tight adherence protein C
MTTLMVGALLATAGIALLTFHVGSLASPAQGVNKSLDLIVRTSGEAQKTRRSQQRSGPTALLLRLLPTSRFSHLVRHWERSGSPARWPVERVVAAKGLAAVGAFVLTLLLTAGSFGWALLLAVIGFLVPDLLMYNAASKRQALLRRDLADSLDILAVIVEAGLPLDSAIDQIAQETDGPVAHEFRRVIQERNFGIPVVEALMNAAHRNDVAEFSAFVSAISQAEKLGVPVAAVIREQTVNLRIARRQHAHEKAQKVPVKIIFPLLLLIFPVMFIVVIAPAIISAMSR